MPQTISTIEEQAKALRKIVVCAIVIEYGALEIIDSSKHDLKQRVRRLIKSVRDIEHYFMYHTSASDTHRNVFRKEFLKDEIVMISELMETVWGLSADSIEEITNAIKANIESNDVPCTR